MFNLDYLFCYVDDFCQQFEPQWQQKLISDGAVQPVRTKSLCFNEIMTELFFEKTHSKLYQFWDKWHFQMYIYWVHYKGTSSSSNALC